MSNFSIIYKIIIIIIGTFAVLNGFFYDNFQLDIETAYYFTYQSNILVIVYFILDIFNIIKKKETFYPRFKGAVTMSITVTFLVYHFLLSTTSGKLEGIDYIRNIILHYIVPIMTIFDYIIFDKKGIYKNADNDIITAIPFIRNIIEYSNSMEDENYIKLTSLLHIKKDTFDITIKDLEDIFEKSVTFSEKLNISSGRENEKVYDLIIKTAKNIVKSGESSIDLDGKIILSMAIRLLAERFMISEISVVDKSGNILEEIYKQNNQTGKLLGQYKKLCPDQHDNILLMNKVSLMSSENIHINSFMFEPIIDMSIKSLVDLFGRVSIIA